jgi:hypothetical protein
MATLGTMRFAPTVFEMVMMEQTCAVGSPARSSSLTIVAPQRVQVPHVLVSITACTPSFTSRGAISVPNRRAWATEVALPTVA